MGLELPDDRRDQGHHQSFQVPVADIPSRDEQEAAGRAVQDMGIDEVGVLGHDRPLFEVGRVDNLFVAGAVPGRQVQGVDGVTSRGGQPSGDPSR